MNKKVIGSICAGVIIIFIYFILIEKKPMSIDTDGADKIVLEDSNGSILNYENRKVSITEKDEIEKLLQKLKDIDQLNAKRVEQPDIVGATNYSVIVYKNTEKLVTYSIFGDFIAISSNNEAEVIYEFKDQNIIKEITDEIKILLQSKE